MKYLNYVILFIALTTTTVYLIHQQQEQIQEVQVQGFKKGFSDDFQKFLNAYYPTFQFHRPDIQNAAYGGADTTPQGPPERIPIVFIHGNSDIGVGEKELTFQTGFSSMIEYLQTKGYTRKDLYVTTWGAGNNALAATNYHSYNYLTYLRVFLEAVLQYTKSPYVNIVGHSMGVTLGRKIVKGGYGNDELAGGQYYLGEPLTKRVKVFVGLAGGNYGLTGCYTQASTLPTCGATNGFFPGQPPFVKRSNFLEDLDRDKNKEGEWVVTGRSPYDEIIGEECIVWGHYTTRIKGEDEEFVKNSVTVGHYGMRDQTGEDVYQIFQKRKAIFVI